MEPMYVDDPSSSTMENWSSSSPQCPAVNTKSRLSVDTTYPTEQLDSSVSLTMMPPGTTAPGIDRNCHSSLSWKIAESSSASGMSDSGMSAPSSESMFAESSASPLPEPASPSGTASVVTPAWSPPGSPSEFAESTPAEKATPRPPPTPPRRRLRRLRSRPSCRRRSSAEARAPDAGRKTTPPSPTSPGYGACRCPRCRTGARSPRPGTAAGSSTAAAAAASTTPGSR